MAVRNTKYTLQILRGIPKISDEAEEENLTQMVDDILEAGFNDRADTLWRKVLNSIKSGVIDIPFSPHIINVREAITGRDRDSKLDFNERGKDTN